MNVIVLISFSCEKLYFIADNEDELLNEELQHIKIRIIKAMEANKITKFLFINIKLLHFKNITKYNIPYKERKKSLT